MNRAIGSFVCPLVQQRLRHVARVVVLGVPLHAHRVDADQRRALAGAGAVDHALGDVVDRQHVVAVHHLVRDAVGRGALVDARDRHLLGDRRRVRELVVLGDDDERDLLDGGEVQPFVERAGAGRAVADPGHGDESRPRIRAPIAMPAATGIESPSMLIGPTITGSSAPALGRCDDVDVEVAAAGVRVALGHVLRKISRGRTPIVVSAPMLRMSGQDGVASAPARRRCHRLPFLAEAAIEPADHLALTEEDDEPLLDVARQPGEVVHLQQLIRVRASDASRGWKAWAHRL